MDRYGHQIEADLHSEFTLDLLDFFRGKHAWAKLLRLLDRLPGTSRFVTAQRADPEYIEQLASMGVDFEAKSEMSEDGYGPVEARLDNLIDATVAQTHLLLQVNGGKPGPVQHQQRPTNAIQKYLEKARVRRHEALIDEVAVAREKRRLKAV